MIPTIRMMTIDDYEDVYELWKSIEGFGIRSIDDSRKGVARFLRRNPTTNIVAEVQGKIVGSILCGHDGRQASFYHVCVHKDFRMHGIGKAMVVRAMEALQAESINKISLFAYRNNSVGNAFWRGVGWQCREDMNVYDFILNDKNITAFNEC